MLAADNMCLLIPGLKRLRQKMLDRTVNRTPKLQNPVKVKITIKETKVSEKEEPVCA